VGTRGARLVLVDDTEVRATMTASWLIQMGWPDVFVLAGGLPAPAPEGGLERGPHRPEVPGLAEAHAEEIDGPALAARLEGVDAPAVIDLAGSPAYRSGHVPGAWFAVRSELPQALAWAGSPGAVVLTSPDGVLARLAAPEAAAAGVARVQVLAGGTDAWRAAGRPLAEGRERMASEPLDVFPKPYERDGGVESAMKEYLTWEVALVEQIERDGDAVFQPYP
jgi:3-mercaptopyruvate sulfurtransferase SseA